VEAAVAQFDSATARMLDGDPSRWKALLSHRDDVSLLGAYGGHVTGWANVSARFDRTAAGYGAGGGGGTTSRERIATWTNAELACAGRAVT
jgi:hypothetical protein